jgi:hypothetical protein
LRQQLRDERMERFRAIEKLENVVEKLKEENVLLESSKEEYKRVSGLREKSLLEDLDTLQLLVSGKSGNFV